MKEISYEGPRADKEEAEWMRKKQQSVTREDVMVAPPPHADIETFIQKSSTSSTGAAQAPQTKEVPRAPMSYPVEEEESHLGHMIFILVLVLAFGLGVGVYALIGTKATLPWDKIAASASTTEKALVTDGDVEIVLTNSPREQVLTDISLAFGKTKLPSDDTRAILFKTKDANGNTRDASFKNFLSAAGLPPEPQALMTSLDPEFTYHIHSGVTLMGVITLHSRSYANSFAAMLDWEPEMTTSLTLPLNPWYNRNMLKSLEGRQFRDERIGGADARVLKDMLGNTALAYTFVNKETLIIAGAEEALAKAITDISVSK